MKRFLVRLFFLSALFSLVFTGCNKKLVYNSENEEFISEITKSYIDVNSSITIGFTQELKANPEQGISFYPDQKGSWSKIDEKTVVFTPEKYFKKNSKIILKADLSVLLGNETASGFYTHPFYILNPDYSVEIDKLVLDSDSNSYSVSGVVYSTLPVSEKSIKKSVLIKGILNKPLIVWEKLAGANNWQFTIKDISVKNRDYPITVSWNGSFLGLKKSQDKVNSGSKTYNIPEKTKFDIVDINSSTENSIFVSFSKSLDTTQEINDYIKIKTFDGSKVNVNSTINDNVISIFNDENFKNVQSITVSQGVKSSNGSSLYTSKTIALDKNWELPSVRFMTQGTILPTSQGTVLPIETRNLSGVVVQAFAIYDYNIIQFLQRNELNENNELYRVGEPVWTKAVNFDWKDDMQNNYVPRGLDISELVKKYPKGMFQIRISFRKQNIKYICRNSHQDFSSFSMPDSLIEPVYSPRESSNWDWFDNLDWRTRDTFWSYKKDPCHPAFYMSRYNSDSLITRNILVSDLGIIAKKTQNDLLYTSITNLKTAKPWPGVSVTAYNFVGKKLQTVTTDSNGFCTFGNPENIFVICAEANGQCSYLKIGNGTHLSISHFEVGGEKASNGVKGFIYGERGVWRPGDTMYLTFVLQDLNKTLPSNIPVNFELIDPLGRKVDTQLFTKSVDGFYSIKTKSEENGTTGLYTAKVKIGGKEWTKNVRVESIIPNKLSVKLMPNTKVLKPLNNEFKLKGEWLHGAPAPNYKADVSVSFSQAQTTFDGYSEYSFTTPNAFIDTSKELIWEGKLDSSSTATFSKMLTTNDDAPGKLKAKFISRVFEPSGAFSTEITSFDYSPYERYVGLRLPKGDKARNMLLTDVEHTADVVLLTEDGKKVSSASLSYEMYKLDWKWWWEKDAYTNATYVNYRHYDRISSGDIQIKDGYGSFKFMIKYPSWGRYLITVKDGRNGHTTGKIVYIDWPGWAGRSTESGNGSSAMITMSTDKNKYTVGNTATITFPSSAGQRGLITIEKGGNIINQAWIETTEQTTVYKLPVTEIMAPNVYVHLTLLQSHLQTANSLPIRLYGIIPLMVENPKSILEPVITTQDKYEPGQNITVSVSEKNGKPMTYTIAVVDEGLLGLTNFHAPKLRDEFYKKEASMLENWDLYSFVMNAYSGKLETLLTVGGGEDIIADGSKDSNRFAPIVKFFGPYTLAAGEKKATNYTMPQYIGAVRTMVIAGHSGAYGTVEKTSIVKSDLMVQPTLPRTIGSGEKIVVPVTVFNGTDMEKEVTVQMKIRGALSASEKTVVSVPASENKTVSFFVNPSATGNANFNFTATCDTASSRSIVIVPVQSRGIPVTYRTDFTVRPGKTESVAVQSPGEISSTVLKAELSTMPNLNLTQRLGYLIRYPHGCIEQITSGAFPQLYLPDFAKLKSEELETVKTNVISVFERYPEYQCQSGAMAYWRGQSRPSHWGSAYAAHFLIEAKKQGYSIPLDVFNPLIDWISETASEWTSDNYCSYADQAYKLFVLSLAGKPNIGAMNRLLDMCKETQEKIILSASYSLAGRKEIARKILSQENIALTFYRFTGGNFGSSVREQALALMAYNLAGDTGNALKYAKIVSQNLSSDKWLSTQETAWSLFTLLPVYKSEDDLPAAYSITSNGQTVNGSVNGNISFEELSPSKNDKQIISVTNTENKTIFGMLYATGMSIPGTETIQNDGLSLSVTYKDKNGNVVLPKHLNQGDTFKIIISVSNNTKEKVQNIALTMPVPTCWEILNDRIADQDNYDSSSYRYMDIKDDAVYTYFDLDSKSSVKFEYNSTVAYKGSYFIPAIHAEAMYDNEISAILPGSYINGANR